jgi:hypothetical protein
VISGESPAEQLLLIRQLRASGNKKSAQLAFMFRFFFFAENAWRGDGFSLCHTASIVL